MRFFDCNCSYGVFPGPVLRLARTPSELIEYMDRCGIDRALAWHAGHRFGHPGEHNGIIIDDLAPYDRIDAVWSVLPPQCSDQVDPEELVKDMVRSGVRAVWLFPNEQHYQLDARTMGDILSVFDELRVPVFIRARITDIGSLMSDFPSLAAIAVSQGPHSIERYLRPILDGFPNLHLETSCYIIDGAIEEFVNRYGSQRLLFGTGFPEQCAGGSLLRLAQAEIGDEAKSDIASGNIERLLSEAKL